MAIKKKLLNPSKFGLNTMRALTSADIVRAVNNKMKTLNVSPAVKDACKYIIKNSTQGNAEFPANFPGLTAADIGIIMSDFGEVTGAIYMLNSGGPYTAAKFPISEAQRLIDYYLVEDGVDVKFSAKAQKGAAPSVISIKNAIENMDATSLSRKHKKALKVMKIIISEDVFSGVLMAADYLKMPGYAELIKLLSRRNLKTGYVGGIPTLSNLEAAIDSMGSYENSMKRVEPLFDAANFSLGGVAGETKMKSVFGGTAGRRYKKWGLLHFPITSEMVIWLNDPKNGATELLTIAARSLSVNQIYLKHTPQLVGTAKWKSGNMEYVIKTFSDSDFKFRSPASTPNPVGNRIGFEITRGAQ
jgi:hypothetical protein